MLAWRTANAMCCSFWLLACQLRFASSKDIRSRAEGFFHASDGVRVGYVISRNTTSLGGLRIRREHDNGGHDVKGTTVLIAPGLSGTAEGFINWFASPLQSHGIQQVVAMDWRGYGLSTGPWNASAPPDGPDAPSYGGLNTWRLAQDLQELIQHLCLTGTSKKLILMGHSMGVNVLLQLIVLHGLDAITGLLLLDDSPRNMVSGGVDVNDDFPSDIATFTADRLKDWLPRFAAFNASVGLVDDMRGFNLTQLSGRWQPYYSLEAALLEQFHAADEPEAESGQRFLAQTTSGLLQWMHFLGPSNGKVMALMMASSMFQDLTGVAGQVRSAGKPFFWYGGEQSLLNVEAIEWSARTMSPCGGAWNRTISVSHGSLTSFCVSDGSEARHTLLRFDGSAGNHCPWLNEDGSEQVFMEALGNFASHL